MLSAELSCLLYMVLISIIPTYTAYSWPKKISIGLLNSVLDPMLYQLTANETVRDLKNASYVPEYVEFEFYQIKACDDLPATNSALKLWLQDNVSLIIGPECSAGMAVVTLLATSLNKPISGYLSVTSDLANKKKYPTLIRVSYTMSYMAQAIRTVLQYYNWTIIAVVRHLDTCNTQLSGIDTEFQNSNINIRRLTLDFTSPASLQYGLPILQTVARIVVVCGGWSPANTLSFLQAAENAGMMTNEYVYITPYYLVQSLSPWEPWLASNVSKDVQASLKLYKNAVVIQTSGENTDVFKQFSKRVTQYVSAHSNLFERQKFDPDSMIQLAPFYDSLYLYGMVLNKSIQFGFDYTNGLDVFNASTRISFSGVTGKVVIDDNGDRIPNYYVSKIDSTGAFSPFLLLGANDTSINKAQIGVMEILSSPVWNTSNNAPPLAVPICGFRAELCPNKAISASSTLALATSIPISVLFVTLVTIVLIFVYRKRVYERDLLQLAWKINVNELRCITKNCFRSSSIYSMNILQSESDVKTNFSVSHDGSVYEGSRENYGHYKDAIVTIKRWKKLGTTVLHREHLVQLRNIKEMNHDNINRFVGFSTDSEKDIVCLWTFCPKRSLKEILFNDDIHLDPMFQVSILRDVITGLDYLHNSPIAFHGRLFVNNCVVDARWIVKLTDFGLNPILNHMKEQNSIELPEEEEEVDKLLCTAPELLRYATLENLKHADVYQYGMIMYQVIYRTEPFADNDMTSAEIIAALKRVTNNNALRVPLRPEIKSLNGLDNRIEDLMLSSWKENPLHRPNVSELKKELLACTKKFGKNLMDHIMSMLERYATNLEKIVDERTTQLNEERKRADRLLYQMLPQSIADALKVGKTILPEVFNCATIYFSDVVGFTTICSRSKPVQVVEMLNNLYSKFDEIILKFDSYKVETIGDAYLVVSGLPVRNEDRHVTNIADMSLEILEVMNKYHVPHFPDEYLKIRIGIHSGPVAGGVVGLTMPKYCLFGDTVNVASRMETTGGAGKIHLTEDTKLMLDGHKNYVVIKRGEIEVKGKGLCTTYWLEKKDG